MENISNLETFAKILIDKGYDGYFQTQAAYPDKIKESIERYLKCCENGTDSLPRGEHMLLSTFLKWDGPDESYVKCHMYVKYLNDKFFLDKMEINFGAPGCLSIKNVELINLSVVTAPTRSEAIAMVMEKPKQEVTKPFKRGRF
ncbi:MAG: hypothetical protein JNM21_14625 [Taibaiella sp.]|nr:hypothetical protein [Taibaiella sp.]